MKKKVVLFLIVSCLMVLNSCRKKGLRVDYEDLEKRRKAMVVEQIEQRGIKDKRVLEIMENVPRHEFVPAEYRAFAYEDSPLPIGEGQTISQPYIVALMTECLNLEGDEKVLEVGTGSGYQAAILSELAEEVYTIEILEPLAERAEELLKNLDYVNVKVKCGDGYLGWEEYAPFDGIMVTCAPDHIPQPLIDQLAEGGRMVIPVGEVRFPQVLKLLEKKEGKTTVRNVVPVRFVPMTGDEVEKRKR
ncbi:protein-L-isoaspartate(D-aspartate) O-methyltransferase [bacterium]|nr:protein-L-isoaspartate(D-aspartate) O-methyltransferase [bacterium]NIN91814.1 protein-L-isoaspartate(D-aspartate) O-methyltransferase [bacterium]NIO18100.1 protein-L-isoaspartate(D-aspartate) O-methyltransferase [bacterium]NIO73065.1 protein-L-isoaspartate(D-aspartate) O-methyltransferase [bacterium]